MDTPQSYYGRAPIDRTHVDVEDPLERRWWCGRFGCSDLRLIDAISQVGTAPAQVEQFLRFSASFDARSLSKPGSDKDGRRKTRRRSARRMLPNEAPAPPLPASSTSQALDEDSPATAPRATPETRAAAMPASAHEEP